MESFDIEVLNELLITLNKQYDQKWDLTTEPESLYDNKIWKKVQDDGSVADLQLGLRIYQHILEYGDCQFEAEM